MLRLSYPALPLKEPSQVVRADPELVSDAPCWQLAQGTMAVDGGWRPSQDPRRVAHCEQCRGGNRQFGDNLCHCFFAGAFSSALGLIWGFSRGKLAKLCEGTLVAVVSESNDCEDLITPAEACHPPGSNSHGRGRRFKPCCAHSVTSPDSSRHCERSSEGVAPSSWPEWSKRCVRSVGGHPRLDRWQC